MSEIEKSLTFLQDGIPQWLQDVTSIRDRVTAMQDEVVKVSVSQSPFGERDTGAVKLTRLAKLDAVAEEATPPAQTPPSPLGSRKRKPPSVRSDGASGPSRYRPRTMVIMEYDGDMQKSFELLVRSIGTARNMLRKAKMQAKMNEMAAAIGSSDDEADDDNDENDEAFMSKASYRPRMTSMRMQAATRSRNGHADSGSLGTPVAMFDTIDKMLEQAQSLCEKSAHLTLREGDCRKELDGVYKHFEEVLETANTEVTKCNASKSQDVPELLSHDTSDTSISSMEESCRKKPSERVTRHLPEPTPQVKPALSPAHTETAPTAIKGMGIAVDDDDSEDEPEFVMPPVRFTSRRAG